MAASLTRFSSEYLTLSSEDDLVLRETNHRCSNDLQLVVSLLAPQSRKPASEEKSQALTDAMERVAILARCDRVGATAQRSFLCGGDRRRR